MKAQCCGALRVNADQPLGWPHSSHFGSSQAREVQTGVWDHLTEKVWRLKQSFIYLVQKEAQIFPVKL